MPVTSHGCEGSHGLDTVFINNVYSGHANAWELTAAISGAHTVGETKLGNSGIADGLWVPEENARKFDNKYYLHLVKQGWAPHMTDHNDPAWRRSDLKRNEVGTSNHEHIMLKTDLCLFWH